MYLLAVTRKNCNVTLALYFLHNLTDVMRSYFGELEEESIRDNFVLIYELLDETMDFGYPQLTESKVLMEFIMQEGHVLKGKSGGAAIAPPDAVTNAVSWRVPGIVHKKNEVRVDFSKLRMTWLF